MAMKEATVFIIDVGRSMGKCNHGRTETDLAWSLRYVLDKLSGIAATSRKTLNIGVIGLRTDGSKNPMQDDPGYENISLLKGLGMLTMTDLRTLTEQLKVSSVDSGDAVSAIVIAIEMIMTFTKTLKYKRQIYLVTDALAPIDADDTDDIVAKINESGIDLTILGVDFDDEEFGFKEEGKPKLKRKNEEHLKALVSKCANGQFATLAEAIDQVDIPRVKAVKPYKSYDGALTLGNPKDESLASFSILVERYFKTKVARPLTASTVVVKSEGAKSQSTQTLEGDEMDGVESTEGFADVKQARSYKVNDSSAPGGKREVEYESLAKGFEYGRTAVHIGESDRNITDFETFKSFEIIGFIPWPKYEPFLNMGETCMTVSRKGDIESQLALSSLINALHELESYAIARLVMKDDKAPQLLLLAPSVDLDVECLYDVPLPFAEDVRSYQFPPLDKVITVSGNTLTKHRLLPSVELTEAMSNFVDAMDISEYGKDDDGNPMEYAPIDETYNPMIHRVNQAVKTRAVHPSGPVDPTNPFLLRFAAPPEALVAETKSAAAALAAAAEVKKVPPAAKGKRSRREQVKPISGLDVDALLGRPQKRPPITAENSVPQFKQALAAAEDLAEIEDATRQLGGVVRGLVAGSFADSQYGRAVENMGVMREGLIGMEEPGLYNAFVRDLKKRLLSGELGGDRRDMWLQIRISKLGLIDNMQSEVADVTKEEAAEFYKSR